MNKKGRPTISDEWGSFIAIPTSFVIASKPLTDKARWLFVLLREYTNGESGVAFPSYDTIRERTGWGRSQISNAIKCLEKHGWLSRQHQFGGVTLYRLVKPVEPNSTETKLLESPKTAVAKNPKPRLQKSQTETSIVPNRDAIKIETTKIEINKIEICESQAEPFDSLANGDAQSVHAQAELCACGDRRFEHHEDGACKLNGLGHGILASEPENRCDEFRPTGYSDTTGMPTVHANGGFATPPEIGNKAPIPAQAEVTASAQNGQLRVLSPLAESAGITASIEAVDPPSTPVSVKKRKTSGKAKTAKTDSPEEIKRKADHKSLMNHIAERMGKLDNPPGQAKAVSEMLKAGHTVERIKQELETQLTELLNHKRRVVTWNTVRQTITSSVFAEQQSQTKLGGNNGKSKSNRNNFFDYINSKPFQQY